MFVAERIADSAAPDIEQLARYRCGDHPLFINRARVGDRRHIVARGLRNLLTERVDWRAGAAQRFNGGVLIARRTDDIAARVEHGVERILEILLDAHTLAALRRLSALIAEIGRAQV